MHPLPAIYVHASAPNGVTYSATCIEARTAIEYGRVFRRLGCNWITYHFAANRREQ